MILAVKVGLLVITDTMHNIEIDVYSSVHVVPESEMDDDPYFTVIFW